MEFLSKSCRLRNPQDFSKATIETGIRRTTEPAGLRVGKFWIFWCTWTVASGWLLSALHQTTVTGYFASYLAFAGVVWFFHKPIFGAAVRFPRLHWRYRFRRFLPRCFLLISLFCLLGIGTDPAEIPLDASAASAATLLAASTPDISLKPGAISLVPASFAVIDTHS
jgi:hypothetical protein